MTMKSLWKSLKIQYSTENKLCLTDSQCLTPSHNGKEAVHGNISYSSISQPVGLKSRESVSQPSAVLLICAFLLLSGSLHQVNLDFCVTIMKKLETTA